MEMQLKSRVGDFTFAIDIGSVEEKDKSKILNEFVATKGHQRKHALRSKRTERLEEICSVQRSRGVGSVGPAEHLLEHLVLRIADDR